MQTHDDREFRRDWLKSLEEKAARMEAKGQSTITAGGPGEEPIDEWKSHGVGVRQMPDDEHGILRVSIGGGDTPIGLNYCVFRGGRGQCVDLLRKALAALQDHE